MMLTVILGPSSSGKSRLARILAASVPGQVALDIDLLWDDLSDSAYAEVIMPYIRSMYSERDVIISGCFYPKHLAAIQDLNLLFVELEISNLLRQNSAGLSRRVFNSLQFDSHFEADFTFGIQMSEINTIGTFSGVVEMLSDFKMLRLGYERMGVIASSYLVNNP